jgi:hypothetical protein
VDLVAKYVERLLMPMMASAPGTKEGDGDGVQHH